MGRLAWGSAQEIVLRTEKRKGNWKDIDWMDELHQPQEDSFFYFIWVKGV